MANTQDNEVDLSPADAAFVYGAIKFQTDFDCDVAEELERTRYDRGEYGVSYNLEALKLALQLIVFKDGRRLRVLNTLGTDDSIIRRIKQKTEGQLVKADQLLNKYSF